MRMNTEICLAWDGGGHLYGGLPLTSASAPSRWRCSDPGAAWTNWQGPPPRPTPCAVRCPHRAWAEVVRRGVRRSGRQLARERRTAGAGGVGRMRTRARRGPRGMHSHVLGPDAPRLHARVDGLLASVVHRVGRLCRAQGVARRPRRRVPQHRAADSDAVSRRGFRICLDGHGRPGRGARALRARRRRGVEGHVRRRDGERAADVRAARHGAVVGGRGATRARRPAPARAPRSARVRRRRARERP